MSNYPVRLVQSAPRLTFAELPAGNLDLYSVETSEGVIGIGTPDELRGLIADGILPPAEMLTFTLEAEAA